MAAHSTASSGVVVAGGEAARFGAVLGGGLDDGGAMDGWLDLSALSGLRDDLISSFLWDERGAAAEDAWADRRSRKIQNEWEGTSGRLRCTHFTGG